MSIRVIKQGLLDTLHDAGRYGYQASGINPGGAMDTIAMKVANMLTGNDSHEAVLEMHFPAPELLFESPAMIAVTGADFSPLIDDGILPLNTPTLLPAGSKLRFHKQVKGMRAYLAISGGFVTDNWLHSSSTHLKAAAGGFNGRALQKNDRLMGKSMYAHEVLQPTILPWTAKVSDLYHEKIFHFIPGNEYWLLDEAAREKIETGVFSAGPQSDRMGYRLQGDLIPASIQTELISTAVTRGTIQLLPNGQLIILMADHQTTGGYPRVGHIISADISSLAQLPPAHNFHLKKIDIAAAEKQLLQQQSNLQQLQNACNFRLQQYLHKG